MGGGNGVIVRVTDRCKSGIDLSKGAFIRLAPLSLGVITVNINEIEQ
jgi:rare lipoprotein A (peptidoglycan hydrolase)